MEKQPIFNDKQADELAKLRHAYEHPDGSPFTRREQNRLEFLRRLRIADNSGHHAEPGTALLCQRDTGDEDGVPLWRRLLLGA